MLVYKVTKIKYITTILKQFVYFENPPIMKKENLPKLK